MSRAAVAHMTVQAARRGCTCAGSERSTVPAVVADFGVPEHWEAAESVRGR